MKEIRADYRNYSSGCNGYPEDNWTHSAVVSNGEDIFRFMIECHLRDARNRNNYPITSHYVSNAIKFFGLEYEVCNLGHRHYMDPVSISRPYFYKKGFHRYLRWRKKVSGLIPMFRDRGYKKVKLEADKANYLRLKKKFEG